MPGPVPLGGFVNPGPITSNVVRNSFISFLFQGENVHANDAAATMNVNLEFAEITNGVML